MRAATEAVQRARDAKLLVVDGNARIRHARRARFVDVLRAGDLVVANDAATLPASLCGIHAPTGADIEVRLAARASLSPLDMRNFSAIVFGAGDYRTPTEQRALPPVLTKDDRLRLGPLHATITAVLDHPRLVSIAFDGAADQIWAGIARHGRPIQYAHMVNPLALWDVWTTVAGPPVAFEPPSAGFALDWQALAEMRRRRIEFATITHAAGISSTGDAELDALLPFDEPYEIPPATAIAIEHTRAERRRIVAIGTTVVRALEHAGAGGQSIRAGGGVATQRITGSTRLHVVDAILSGVHEPATSHYRLLSAFASDATLARADAMMDAAGYRTHEFGDSVFVEFSRRNHERIPDFCEEIVDLVHAFM